MKIFSNVVKDRTTTIGDRNEVDQIMALPLFIQAILGQQILNPKWCWKKNIFEHIFIVLLIIYVFFGTVEFLKEATDITSKGEAYYTLIITLSFIAKHLLCLRNRVAFQNVYLIAKTTLVVIINEISPKKSIYLMKKLKMVVKLFFATISVPIIIYILTAIWPYMHGGERVTLSKTTSTLMPMTTPYYEIGFVLHAIFLFHMAFSICVIDMWFVVVMFFFCVTCDSLLVLLQVKPKNKNETNLAYGIRINENLHLFYKCHQELMKYFNLLNDMYEWQALLPLIGFLFESCLCIFLMTEEVQWSFISNIIPVIAVLLVYNWFGEQVKTKATELNRALQKFDFLSLQPAAKKNYIIIVTYNINKRYSVKTAFGKDLSLSTMTDILKASYQAFTLLKTMKN